MIVPVRGKRECNVANYARAMYDLNRVKLSRAIQFSNQII